MIKQSKIDTYFAQKQKDDDISERRVDNSDSENMIPLNMSFEQFKECTNIVDIIKADLNKRISNEVTRNQLYLKMDKHVSYVYEKWKVDPEYRKKKAHILKPFVIAPKPWITSKDRELLKSFNMETCFVDMYTDNIVQDMADRFLKKFVKRKEDPSKLHGSLTSYINDKFRVYLRKKGKFRNALRHLRCKYGSRDTREMLKREIMLLKEIGKSENISRIDESDNQIEDLRMFSTNDDIPDINLANQSSEFLEGITPFYTSTQIPASQLLEREIATKSKSIESISSCLDINRNDERTNQQNNNSEAENLFSSQLSENLSKSREGVVENIQTGIVALPSRQRYYKKLSKKIIHEKIGNIVTENLKKYYPNLWEEEINLTKADFIEELYELLENSEPPRDTFLHISSLLGESFEPPQKCRDDTPKQLLAITADLASRDHFELLQNSDKVINENTVQACPNDNIINNKNDKSARVTTNEENCEDLNETRVPGLDTVTVEKEREEVNENTVQARPKDTFNTHDESARVTANEENDADLNETRIPELDTITVEREREEENNLENAHDSRLPSDERLSPIGKDREVLNERKSSQTEEETMKDLDSTTVYTISRHNLLNDACDNTSFAKNKKDVNESGTKTKAAKKKIADQNVELIGLEEFCDLSPTLSLIVEPISRRKRLKKNIPDNRNVQVKRSKIKCFETINSQTINFDDFRRKTNIKEFIYADIINKFPITYKKYVPKIEKLIKKFYIDFIKGKNSWPKGIYLKSNSEIDDLKINGSKEETQMKGQDCSITKQQEMKNLSRNRGESLDHREKLSTGSDDFGEEKLMVSPESVTIGSRLEPGTQTISPSLSIDPFRDENTNTKVGNIYPEEIGSHISLEEKEIPIVYLSSRNKYENIQEASKHILDVIKEESNYSDYEDSVEYIPSRSPEPILVPDEAMSVEQLLDEMFRSPQAPEEGPYGLPRSFIKNIDNDNVIKCNSFFSSVDKNKQVEEFENSEVLESNMSKPQLNSRAVPKSSTERSDINLESVISNHNGTKEAQIQAIPNITTYRSDNNSKGKTSSKVCGELCEVKAVAITKKQGGRKVPEKAKITLKRRTVVEFLKQVERKRQKLAKSDDLVPQKTHNFDPLQLIRKVKYSDPVALFTESAQKSPSQDIVQDVDFFIEDPSQVSISADKIESTGIFTTSQLLNTDNTYFTSSQLAHAVINSNISKNSSVISSQKGTMCDTTAEMANPTPVALIKTTDLQSESCKISETIVPDLDQRANSLLSLHKRNISPPQFGCITYLSLHQVSLNSKSNSLMYESSVPFLQSLEKQPMQATINFRSNGFRQLNVCGESLRLLLGLTQFEWTCFQHILGVVGSFRYRPNDPAPNNKSLPHRVLYYLFKTLPKFSQVTYEFEDTNINIIKCVKLSCSKPIECITAVLDPAILEAMENLKKAGS